MIGHENVSKDFGITVTYLDADLGIPTYHSGRHWPRHMLLKASRLAVPFFTMTQKTHSHIQM